MTAPVYVQSWTNTANPSGTISVTISGQTSGNLLLCTVSSGDIAKNFPTPIGWNAIREDDQSNGTLATFWKISDGTETSVSFSVGAPNTGYIIAVHEYSGAHDTSPIDTSSGAIGTGTSSNGTAITTGYDDCKVVHATVQINNSNPTHTPPTGYTERTDVNTDSAQNYQSQAVSDDDYASAGSTGTVSGTWSQSDVWITQLISIRPGAASVTGTLTKTLDGATVSSDADVLVSGALSETIDSMTASSAGELGPVPVVGILDITLGDATVSTNGEVLVSGTFDKTLGDVTLSSEGDIFLVGLSNISLDDMVVSSSGGLFVEALGVVDITLDDNVLSSLGNVDLAGAATITLGDTLISSIMTAVFEVWTEQCESGDSWVSQSEASGSWSEQSEQIDGFITQSQSNDTWSTQTIQSDTSVEQTPDSDSFKSPC